VNKLRALGLLVEGDAALAGFPTFGFVNKAIVAAGDVLTGNVTKEDVDTLKGTAKEIQEQSKGLLNPAEKHEPPEGPLCG
jgi:hypothetical protein